MTDAGRRALRDKRNARVDLVARALGGDRFTDEELVGLAAAAALLERLARTV